MKIIELEQNSPEWLQARLGKITGSRLKDIVVKRGDGKKIGYYELIAESLGIPADDESAMARGHRLEEEAATAFQERYGVELKKTGLWVRDDEERIAISPDRYIDLETAVEIKCLSSARHIEAILTGKVPKDYDFQKLQYFIVNDKLQKLYFAFYDPRIPMHKLFVIEVTRDQVQEEVETYLQYQKELLEEVKQDIIKLTF